MTAVMSEQLSAPADVNKSASAAAASASRPEGRAGVAGVHRPGSTSAMGKVSACTKSPVGVAESCLVLLRVCMVCSEAVVADVVSAVYAPCCRCVSAITTAYKLTMCKARQAMTIQCYSEYTQAIRSASPGALKTIRAYTKACRLTLCLHGIHEVCRVNNDSPVASTGTQW